jgi:bacterioferritin-associated ferredoxin
MIIIITSIRISPLGLYRSLGETMIVCLCHGVSEKKIRHWVQTGQVSSSKEVGQRCGAGRDCGSCQDQIKEIVDESYKSCELARHRSDS